MAASLSSATTAQMRRSIVTLLRARRRASTCNSIASTQAFTTLRTPHQVSAPTRPHQRSRHSTWCTPKRPAILRLSHSQAKASSQVKTSASRSDQLTLAAPIRLDGMGSRSGASASTSPARAQRLRTQCSTSPSCACSGTRTALSQTSVTTSYFPESLNALLSQMTESQPARALNTDFQASTTRWAYVRYTVRITCVAGTTLLGGSAVNGRVEFLRDAASPPTTVREQARNGLQVTQILGLVVGINTTSSHDYVLGGWVPPGHFIRLATVNEVGTAAFSIEKTQEWLA